jgi:aspartate aminotransferase
VVGLGAGEPDFDTPDFIKEAAVKALKDGFTKYTPVGGTVGLKKAIVAKFERDNGLKYAPDQILVSCGAKHSIYNLMQALLNKGDEVIIPAPYWVSYPDMALLAEAKPVIVTAGVEQRFKITPDQLQAAITPRSRLFIMNSPSNPTGIAYTRAELAALGAVLLKHPQITIATDDIYESILWVDEPFSNIVMACPDLFDRTVVINGVSKTYAMTGWRLGYLGAPAALCEQILKVQQHVVTCAPSFAQAAGVAALQGPQACVAEMVAEYDRRRRFMTDALNAIPGVRCPSPEGAFYLFPRVDYRGMDSGALARFLIEEAHVAVTPGAAFGRTAAHNIRLTFATSMANLRQAAGQLNAVMV